MVNENYYLIETNLIYKKTDLSGNSNRLDIKNIVNEILSRLGMRSK